jgi:hypothetical protein
MGKSAYRQADWPTARQIALHIAPRVAAIILNEPRHAQDPGFSDDTILRMDYGHVELESSIGEANLSVRAFLSQHAKRADPGWSTTLFERIPLVTAISDDEELVARVVPSTHEGLPKRVKDALVGACRLPTCNICGSVLIFRGETDDGFHNICFEMETGR